MPPFLMMILVAFVVIMVMMGENPVEKWRAEQEKYGKDPLAREINKFNEEKSKNGMDSTQYTPPPGAMLYKLPPDQAQILAPNQNSLLGGMMQQDTLVRPAPDVPMEQWGSPYPSYMYAPKKDSDILPPGDPTTMSSGFGQQN